MNEQVSSWLLAVDGLPEAHERLSRVVVLNEDALSVIKREDGKGTFFYLDPPYVQSARHVKQAYEHEMTDQEHGQVIRITTRITGPTVVADSRVAMPMSHSQNTP